MHLKKLVFLVRERRPNIFCLERFAASQGNKNKLSVGADQLKKETENEPKRKNQERGKLDKIIIVVLTNIRQTKKNIELTYGPKFV